MSDGGAGPRCALHFDAASLATCQRCGRFSCASCLVEREPPLCTACAPSITDPYLMFTSVAVLRSQDRDALEASESLVRGRFWSCLGFGLAAFAVCFVPMIIGGGIMNVLFEELGLPRYPLELFNDFIDRFAFDVGLTSLLYVAYVTLHRTAGEELAPMRWQRPLPLRS